MSQRQSTFATPSAFRVTITALVAALAGAAGGCAGHGGGGGQTPRSANAEPAITVTPATRTTASLDTDPANPTFNTANPGRNAGVNSPNTFSPNTTANRAFNTRNRQGANTNPSFPTHANNTPNAFIGNTPTPSGFNDQAAAADRAAQAGIERDKAAINATLKERQNEYAVMRSDTRTGFEKAQAGHEKMVADRLALELSARAEIERMNTVADLTRTRADAKVASLRAEAKAVQEQAAARAEDFTARAAFTRQRTEALVTDLRQRADSARAEAAALSTEFQARAAALESLDTDAQFKLAVENARAEAERFKQATLKAVEPVKDMNRDNADPGALSAALGRTLSLALDGAAGFKNATGQARADRAEAAAMIAAFRQEAANARARADTEPARFLAQAEAAERSGRASIQAAQAERDSTVCTADARSKQLFTEAASLEEGQKAVVAQMRQEAVTTQKILDSELDRLAQAATNFMTISRASSAEGQANQAAFEKNTAAEAVRMAAASAADFKTAKAQTDHLRTVGRSAPLLTGAAQDRASASAHDQEFRAEAASAGAFADATGFSESDLFESARLRPAQASGTLNQGFAQNTGQNPSRNPGFHEAAGDARRNLAARTSAFNTIARQNWEGRLAMSARSAPADRELDRRADELFRKVDSMIANVPTNND